MDQDSTLVRSVWRDSFCGYLQLVLAGSMNAEGRVITVWYFLREDFLYDLPLGFFAWEYVSVWKKLLVTTKCFGESDAYPARREIVMTA